MPDSNDPPYELVEPMEAERATGMDAELAQQEAVCRFGRPDHVAADRAAARIGRHHRLVVIAALLVGTAVAYVDSRPTWDDTGVTAALVAMASGVLGFLAPPRAWLVTVLVGGGIPILGLAVNRDVGSLLALAVAGVFAGIGAVLPCASGGSRFRTEGRGARRCGRCPALGDQRAAGCRRCSGWASEAQAM